MFYNKEGMHQSLGKIIARHRLVMMGRKLHYCNQQILYHTSQVLPCYEKDLDVTAVKSRPRVNKRVHHTMTRAGRCHLTLLVKAQTKPTTPKGCKVVVHTFVLL